MLPRQICLNKLQKIQGLGLRDRQFDSFQPLSSFTHSFFDSLSKSKDSFLDSVKSSFLGSASEPTVEAGAVSRSVAAASAGTSTGDEILKTETLKQSRHSVRDAFPGVFVILDRFPAGNQVASLQSLAEIGALFPDAATLTQFHQSQNVKSCVSKNIQQHLCDVQLRVVQQLSPSRALDVYKAFAALRFNPADEVQTTLFTTVIEHAENLELPHVASFLQARLMVHPVLDASTTATFSRLLSDTLKRSRKRHLEETTYVVHILDLFVKYHLYNEDVLSDVVDYLNVRVKGLSTHDLVSTVSSMIQLEYPADRLFDAIVVEVLRRGTDSFTTSELARLAAALTEIKHFDVMTDVLMDSIAITCQKRMRLLNFDELVDLLWAYSHHMHFHQDAKLLECLATGLVAKLDSVKAVSGAMCVKLCDVVSASDLGPEKNVQILEALSRYAPSHLPSLTISELMTVATGCRKSRFVCDRILGSLREALESKSGELTLANLCRILNNFTSLNFHPGEALLDLALSKTDDTDDLSPTETSRLIWSLAYFDKLTGANAGPLFRHLQNFSRSNFNTLDIQKLILSEKLMLLLNSDGDVDSEPEEEALIPEPLRSELIATWRERMYFTRSVSPFQQEVSRALTNLNIQHEADALIDNGDLSVDFLLLLGSARSHDSEADKEMSSGLKVVLECDGPRRLSVNAPHTPLGQTVTFKKLLKAQGLKIVVVSKEEWHKKTHTEQEQLLRRLLKL